MERILTALALIHVVLLPVHSFVVVCPKEIRPNMTFSVNIFTLPNTGSTFLVEVKDLMNSAAWTGSSVQINIPAGTLTGMADIENVPNSLIDGSTYIVLVTETPYSAQPVANKPFSKQVNVYVPPSPLVIQTDKGMYKPGDSVLFRVLNTDKFLAPLKTDVKLEIKDPVGNDIMVETWTDTALASGSMILSSDPMPGKYQIYVEAGTTSFKYATFLVEEYVLPRFEVVLELDAPYAVLASYGASVSGSIKGKVQAIYSNGELVHGEMVLKVNGVQKMTFMEFDGSELFNIEMDTTQTAGSLTVMAIMTEKHTANAANTTQVVSVVEAPFKASVRMPLQHTTAGLDYTIQVDLTDPMGSPLSNAFAAYELVWESQYNVPILSDNQRKGGVINYSTNPVTLTLTPNDDWEKALLKSVNVYFTLVDSTLAGNLPRSIPTEVFPREYRATNGGTLLQIEQAVTTGTQDEVCVTITAVSLSVDSNNIFYQVIDTYGPGKINHYNTQKCVTILKTFAPKSKIVAYYMDTSSKEQELLTASVDLLVEWTSDLSVSVNIVPSIAKPGDMVDILVNTEPATAALVYISAVDKSTTFLASANDITKAKLEEAFQLVRLFDRPTTKKETPPFPMPRGGIMPAKPLPGRKRRCVSLYPGTYQTEISPAEISEMAGVLVITDALFYGVSSSGCGDWGDRMAMADGAVARGPDNAAEDDDTVDENTTEEPETTVRTEFPETWLWYLTETDATTGASVDSMKLPDTITNWVVNAFGVSDTGVGVADTQEVTATQDLFVVMDLPYSTVRNEQFDLKIVVFNYKSTSLQVTIELLPDVKGQYETNGTITTSKRIAGGHSDVLLVGIRPSKIGTITLRARATSGANFDIEERELIVKPEGREVIQSKEVSVHVGSTTKFDLKSLVNTDSLVEGSLRIVERITGMIMGPFIANLEGRITVPTGCGEQNMITLVPGLYVEMYMASTNLVDQEIQQKIKRYAGIGYAKELKYRHQSGGYSAFGPSSNRCGCDRVNADDGPNASTWLTGFVISTMSVMYKQKTTFVSEEMLRSGAAFLCASMVDNDDTFFNESGRVIHSEMQGGTGKPGVGLTAMVLNALLDHMEATQNQDFNTCIDGALEWLLRKADSLNSPFSIAIVAYSLAKAGKIEKATELLSEFENKYTDYGKYDVAVKQTPCAGFGCDVRTIYPHQSGATTVETLGYLLGAYIAVGNKHLATEKKDFLLGKRQAGGSFYSTQDMAVGLRGLAEYASAHPDQTADFTVRLTNSDGQSVAESVTMDVSNYYALLERPIDMVYGEDMTVNITASGTAGTPIVTFVAYYNARSNTTVKQLDLDVSVTTNAGGNTVVNTCFKVNTVQDVSPPSMLLLAVSQPTGQEYDPAQMEDNMSQKIEYKPDEGKIYLYFDPPASASEEICSHIPMISTFYVVDRERASVSLQDYYNPENKVEQMYMTQDAPCFGCGDETTGASATKINTLLLVLAAALAVVYQALGRQ